jgi:hypothetical protein
MRRTRRVPLLLLLAAAGAVYATLAACSGDRDRTWIGGNADVTIDSERDAPVVDAAARR